MLWCTVLLLTSLVVADQNDGPIIKIKSGKIQGRFVENPETNSTYYAFQGIPYAKPPIGNLRFQAPVPPEPWTGIKSTLKDANICIQDFRGSEDCLYLNVFTNQLPTENTTLMPVMFWIHGGAFYRESSDTRLYGPDYLLTKNVVYVSLNYRLSVFGYLNSLDEAAPGNAGLKDLLLALRWVQTNIDKFNGDPKSVTLFGQSAGAACAEYLVLSKLGKGLFHKVIAMSGSTLNQIALQPKPREKFIELKNLLNISSENTTEIVEQLQNLDAYEVFNASVAHFSLRTNTIIQPWAFIPSIEYNHRNAIIKNESIDLLSNKNFNRVPYLTGYATGESYLYLPDINSGRFDLKEFERDTSLLVSTMLYLKNEHYEKLVIQDILNKYFKNSTVVDTDKFIQFQKYNIFVTGIRTTVELMCTEVPVYLYQFSYKGHINPEVTDVVHSEDMNYIFYRTYNNLTAEDHFIMDRMTTLLTNFAKTGNPNSKGDALQWIPYTKGNQYYLDIGNQLSVKKDPDNEDYLFWRNIMKKYSKYLHLFD